MTWESLFSLFDKKEAAAQRARETKARQEQEERAGQVVNCRRSGMFLLNYDDWLILEFK